MTNQSNHVNKTPVKPPRPECSKFCFYHCCPHPGPSATCPIFILNQAGKNEA